MRVSFPVRWDVQGALMQFDCDVVASIEGEIADPEDVTTLKHKGRESTSFLFAVYHAPQIPNWTFQYL